MTTLTFSHRGSRSLNEDVVVVLELSPENMLYLVVDGMGGYENGLIAAKTVVESICTYLLNAKSIGKSEVQQAVNKANLAIRQKSEFTSSRLGATVGGLLISNNNASCFWVGDVKIIQFRNNKLEYESRPHTLVNEIKDNGSIKDVKRFENLKHVVTKSIQGDLDKSQIDYHSFGNVSGQDLFMVCSDGVHDLLDAIQLQMILQRSSSSSEAFVTIELELSEYAKDNYSLILTSE